MTLHTLFKWSNRGIFTNMHNLKEVRRMSKLPKVSKHAEKQCIILCSIKVDKSFEDFCSNRIKVTVTSYKKKNTQRERFLKHKKF